MAERLFRKFLSSIIFVLALMVAPFVTTAAENPTDGYIFRLMDMDGNKKINRSEFKLQKMMVFFIRDADRDGKLDSAELPIIGDDVFRSIDSDNDGQISAFEFAQAKVGVFGNLDGNGDGGITFKEFMAFRQKIK